MKSSNKFVILILILSMFVLVACGAENDEGDVEESPTETVVETSNDETSDDDNMTEETDDDTSDDEADMIDTGNAYTLVGGEVDFTISGNGIGGDFDPVGNDFSAFDIRISPDGEFLPALLITGIPRTASAGDVIELGNPVTATQACIFFQEGMSLATTFTAISVSGTITLSELDGATASGTFEAVLVESSGSDCIDTVGGDDSPYTIFTADDNETYTLTGTFTGVTVVEENE